MTIRALRLTALVAAFAAPASGQLVPIRTVPLAQGDQFLIYPSNNLGMGGVSIALADSLLDPFRNPAAGARVGATRLFSAPTIYQISREAGGGRTLPIATLVRSGSWFGALSFALQQVDASRPIPPSPIIFLAQNDLSIPIQVDTFAPGEGSHGNAYAFASLGRAVPGIGLSLGGSVQWAALNALDGVDLLYPGSARVQQEGNGLDIRLGVVKEWTGDRSLEALLLHNRLRITQDVTYLDTYWDPAAQQFIQRPRLESHRDRANTWGLHLEYRRPLAAAGWRIGWLATANRLSSPGIPDDKLLSLARDLGRADAYNLGVGVAKTSGPATFGLDAIFEPIWSATWAVAAGPVVTTLGDTIAPGERTTENRFRFSNALFRIGVSRDLPFSGLDNGAGFQLGLVVRAIHYRLAQDDRVEVTERRSTEGWLEWTPTWGLNLRFAQFELRYRGRVTSGAGRPGLEPIGAVPQPLAERGVLAPDVLLAPAGTLSLSGVTTLTHQVSLSLPLR